jgi:hypothetical protein
MRVLIAVFGLAAAVVAAQADYSAVPVTTPVWPCEPATNASPPPHWVSKQPGHYSLTDWRRVIDSTWGPGLPVSEKLAIFDLFWDTIDAKYACFNNIAVNWDSLRTVYRTEIEDTVSGGRFAAIMNHLAMSLREGHTYITDAGVTGTQLRPGVPLWVVGAWMDVGYFGAGLTPLPDSSLLVYRVAENHPLGLAPGDIVLGYDRRRWTDILSELLEAQLPIRRQWCWGSCSTAMTHSLLNAAGMNWHLFDTIDIVKYSTGDTVHLPTALLKGRSMTLFATDQINVPGVPMPATGTTPSVSYGIVSGTRIGYIYGWRWAYDAAAEFYNAVSTLISDTTLKGLIVDLRYNEGGNMFMSDSGLHLLFSESLATICFSARSDPRNRFPMEVISSSVHYAIPGNGIGFHKPIAVLVGPGAVSSGDQVAFRMAFHPRVKTFGKSTNAAFDAPAVLDVRTGWWAAYARFEACLAADTTRFLTHREFPVDVPVWLTRDAAARGEDNVVTTAMAWIDSAAAVVEEHEPLTATIVRDVLLLDGDFSGTRAIPKAALLDVTGSRALDLKPGANDLSGIAPGVYFVREGWLATNRIPHAARKVVVTK